MLTMLTMLTVFTMLVHYAHCARYARKHFVHTPLTTFTHMPQVVFRSAYFPVKGVIDGDFISVFNRMPPEEQRAIADELDRTPAEISKKLEEMAAKIL